MTAAPRVSLLMPVRNRAHLLDRVLERLAENTTYPNVELVTVDDRSEDTSVEVLRRWAASGRIADMRVLANRGAGAISALTRLPSARPCTRGITSDITRPISCGDDAPVSATTSPTIACSSSSES